MSQDAFDRLRAADPASGFQPAPPEELLHGLLRQPRSADRGPRRRHLSPTVALVAVVVAIVAAVAMAPTGGPGPSLAERAYAQLTGADFVLHTRLSRSVRWTSRDANESPDKAVRWRVEEWQYGGYVHTVSTPSAPGSRRAMTAPNHQSVGPGGALRLWVGTGRKHRGVIRRSDGKVARQTVREAGIGFSERFRRDYEEGRLDEGQAVRFERRAARRYVVDAEEPNPRRYPFASRVRREYFVDAGTGAPLGSMTVTHKWGRNRIRVGADGVARPVGKPGATETTREVVRVLERLPATRANIRLARP